MFCSVSAQMQQDLFLILHRVYRELEHRVVVQKQAQGAK